MTDRPGGPPDEAPPAHSPSTAKRIWGPWDVAWLVLALLVGMLAMGIVIGLLGLEGIAETLALTVGSQLVIGGAALLLLRGRPDRVTAAGLVPCPPGDVGKAALLTLPLMLIMGLTTLAVRWALDLPLDNPQQVDLRLHEMGPVTLTVMLVLVAGVAPLAEELCFRGVMLDALRARFGDGWGIVGSSLAFGLMHVEVSVVVGTAMLGAAAAVARIKTGSLWPAVAMHATNNAIATAIMAAELGP